jgi:hyperosmotically inducible protein
MSMAAKLVLKTVTPLLALILVSGCSERQQQKVETEAKEAGRATERKVDNAAMTTAVKSKLAADVRLSTLTSINVDSSGDIVTLTGTVPKTDDKRKAEEVAMTVDGVRRVINNLEVKP